MFGCSSLQVNQSSGSFTSQFPLYDSLVLVEVNSVSKGVPDAGVRGVGLDTVMGSFVVRSVGMDVKPGEESARGGLDGGLLGKSIWEVDLAPAAGQIKHLGGCGGGSHILYHVPVYEGLAATGLVALHVEVVTLGRLGRPDGTDALKHLG